MKKKIKSRLSFFTGHLKTYNSIYLVAEQVSNPKPENQIPKIFSKK